MTHLKKGYIHLYTGAGKGKTTAAFGLALRAAGNGLRVYIAQFAKGTKSGELELLKKLSRKVTIKQFGARSFITKHPTTIDRTLAESGIAEVAGIIAHGRYDMVILDEIGIACRFGLLSVEPVIAMLKARPSCVEIILTGRNAPKELIDIADLVTEMKEIKHYFQQGVGARAGIEY
jgi:cob(I)alamin adenosyltransferase